MRRAEAQSTHLSIERVQVHVTYDWRAPAAFLHLLCPPRLRQVAALQLLRKCSLPVLYTTHEQRFGLIHFTFATVCVYLHTILYSCTHGRAAKASMSEAQLARHVHSMQKKCSQCESNESRAHTSAAMCDASQLHYQHASTAAFQMSVMLAVDLRVMGIQYRSLMPTRCNVILRCMEHLLT